MSITDVGHGSTITSAATQRSHGRAARDSFSHLKVGQTIELKVLRRIDEHKFVAHFGDAKHLVETSMALTAGNTVRATVASVGDKLELRYIDAARIDSEPVAAPVEPEWERTPNDAGSHALGRLQAEYAVALKREERDRLLAAMAGVDDPDHIARCGLYLSKLQGTVSDDALHAVYGALSWLQSRAPSGRAIDAAALSDLGEGGDFAAADLGEDLAQALNLGADVPTDELASSSDDGSDSDDLARELLNEQDGSSVAYSFGRVPLMVADQLVELDVVLFRDREGSGQRHATRRLVMSLRTDALGRVEVVAQAVGERLTIALNAETPEASAALSRHADEVRELVGRLGWSVDTIRYDISAPSARAAGHIVQHVLEAGTIDRVF